MSPSSADDRLRRILEACFAAIEAGETPDLDTLCGGDSATVRRVEGLLARERDMLAAARRLRASAPAAPDLALAMPARVGDFTVLEPLGVGGMSRVYRARQEPLGREVALKILRDDLVATELGRLRFQREASITAALDHPNIVPVYAAGEAEGHVYLAMKLLRGQPLDRLPKPIAPRTVAGFGVGVARALQSAHDIGVVHRDVKPANIVVEKGIAYVVDFGLSSFTHSAGAITRPDSAPGTLIYLAPELARQKGGGLDPRVDVYGLGATLYEALAGRPPFAAGNPIHVLHQILNREPPSLALAGADRDLETIVLRALEKEPARRFQTAGEMAEELARYLDGLPIRSRPIGAVERAWRAVRRRPVQSALIGAVVALAAGLATVLSLAAWSQEQRWSRTVVAAREAVAAGDLVRAERCAAELVATRCDPPRIDAVRQQIAYERAVQALTALLQSPITYQDPQVMRGLVDELAKANAATAAQAQRAEVALAFASRLLDPNPVAHRPLTAATMQAWPRTTAAVGAWSAGRVPSAAVAGLAASVEPFDHLFAALAMRLAKEPPDVVERELRLVHAAGAAADAAQHSLAWTLEAAGQIPTPAARIARLRAAYDVSNRLRESPSYAVLAEYHCARLAALLRDLDGARRHLAAATALADASPHLRNLTRLSELEVLLELDLDAFWTRWRELRPDCERLPQFWLRAGYAEVAGVEGELPADVAARARAHFQRGLELAPQPAVRADLQIALLQLEWAECAPLAAVVAAADGEALRSARERLLALAERALAFAAAVTDQALADDLRSDAQFVAARASFAAGERGRGWQLLEAVCRESGDPAALAHYAVLVGERLLSLHLQADGSLRTPAAGELDADAAVAAPIQDAANRALLRAEQVVAAAADEGAVEPHVAYEARVGLFLAAFHLGEVAIALPLARELGADAPGLPLEPLLDCCLLDGGFHVDQWLAQVDAAPARVAALLTESCATMRAMLDRGERTAPAVRATLDRWRSCAALRATMASGVVPWQEPWRAVAALEAHLGAGR